MNMWIIAHSKNNDNNKLSINLGLPHKTQCIYWQDPDLIHTSVNDSLDFFFL